MMIIASDMISYDSQRHKERVEEERAADEKLKSPSCRKERGKDGAPGRFQIQEKRVST